MSWDLGKGETAVISYVIMYPNFHVIIDDYAARRCAKTLNIKSLGTLGILLLAKRRGVIPSVSASIKKLRQIGMILYWDKKGHLVFLLQFLQILN